MNRAMTVETRRARRDDAETLTAIAHAAKRYWRYPEEWLRLWAEDLTVTPDFIDADRVYCAQRSREVVGFCAVSGEGLTAGAGAHVGRTRAGRRRRRAGPLPRVRLRRAPSTDPERRDHSARA